MPMPSPNSYTPANAHPSSSLESNGPSLAIADALTGTSILVSQFPHLIHSVSLQGRTVAIELRVVSGNIVLAPASGVAPGDTLINGSPLRGSVSLPPGDVFTMKFGRRLLFFQTNPPEGWPGDFDNGLWGIYDTNNGDLLGEIPPCEIPATAASQGWNPSTCAACPRGMSTGFFLADVSDILSASGASAFADNENTPADTVHGHFLCPACWLRFDSGDALNIAVHESLRGDPVLGENAMLRFFPTRFNDPGLALDPMGLPSTDLACPHCRRQLPAGFLDQTHKIFSLIGAPSAGKSYFLAVLTRILQERAFLDFGIVFKDGDPSGNMVLNQMRTRLFSGSTPEECALDKTAMEGNATYEIIPRFGKMVAMPRPFIYSLENSRTPDYDGVALILYDNAGEHFEPGHNMVENPGALHVVSSAGIFFLFDPTSNLRFRKELSGVPDPQLHQNNRDQQDSILAEMEVRVRKMLALAPSQKLPVPVAFLVGKCDVWQSLLDARQFPRPVRDGCFVPEIVDKNSVHVRELLAHLCPGLVAQAESLSENVRYFAVSSLGHSPQPLPSGILAPDPAKLDPVGIEAPAYWLLHHAVPGFLPVGQ